MNTSLNKKSLLKLMLMLPFFMVACKKEDKKNSSSDASVVLPGACGESNGSCYIFVTAGTVSHGQIDASTTNSITPTIDSNAVPEADAICNADANKPNDSTYKALISNDSARTACMNEYCSPAAGGDLVDWPLQANTQYKQADGTTVIGTTNDDQVFEFPLENTVTSSVAYYWTGLSVDNDWVDDDYTNDMCSGWTSSSNMSTGTFGASGGTGISNFVQASAACDTSSLQLLCVEVP